MFNLCTQNDRIRDIVEMESGECYHGARTPEGGKS